MADNIVLLSFVGCTPYIVFLVTMFLIKGFALKINFTWVYYYGMLCAQVSVCAYIMMCAIEVYLTGLMS